MSIKILNSLLLPSPLPEDHVNTVCKIGKESETCRFLTMSPGFTCGKFSSIRGAIDERFSAGSLTATGDNCEGILGKLLETKAALIGKKIEYIERMPTVEVMGTLSNIAVEGVMLTLTLDVESRSFPYQIAIDSLQIDETEKSLSFSLRGFAAYAGSVEIFK